MHIRFHVLLFCQNSVKRVLRSSVASQNRGFVGSQARVVCVLQSSHSEPGIVRIPCANPSGDEGGWRAPAGCKDAALPDATCPEQIYRALPETVAALRNIFSKHANSGPDLGQQGLAFLPLGRRP